jgi:hypothetical protein
MSGDSESSRPFVAVNQAVQRAGTAPPSQAPDGPDCPCEQCRILWLERKLEETIGELNCQRDIVGRQAKELRERPRDLGQLQRQNDQQAKTIDELVKANSDQAPRIKALGEIVERQQQRLTNQTAVIDSLDAELKKRDQQFVEKSRRIRWLEDRVKGLETQAEGLKQARIAAANRPSLEAIALRAENIRLERKLMAIGLLLDPKCTGVDVQLEVPAKPDPKPTVTPWSLFPDVFDFFRIPGKFLIP